jgi:ligand-binding sensor protein
MKWNNLAATDVITATKIATDHGGDVQELKNWTNFCGSK